MSVSDIQREILGLVDEDYYGVWEIGWRLFTVLGVDPSVDPAEAAEAVALLRHRGVVAIYVREWIDDPPRPLGSSGRAVDLNDPAAWREPEPGLPQFLIGAADDRDDATARTC
ncbi:hypothetical protein [Aestuariimicrobium sp. T2.26MG-19.2B]|uniref:hypothetical protein n=1 Tax=Aestuariimicrobium sp. T2.26MG-19.2B TaxID=3040679 RepID=UPI00247742D3|nr:hypothetical protein [Aestuariimicrobium sp. T2.26MG-19.2B]CAI9409233.1 hypothetical protein AESSP_02195 [Aestuariimicrobium sp. T2.26MG-19.2B]